MRARYFLHFGEIMQLSGFLGWLLFAVAVASLVLIGMTWLEGALVIWCPRCDGSKFWMVYDKLLLPLRYISASEEKLSRARFALNPERMNDEK